MEQENLDLERLLLEEEIELELPPEEVIEAQQSADQRESIARDMNRRANGIEIKKKAVPKKKQKRTFPWKGLLSFLGKLLLFVVETALLLAIAVYGVMFVLAKGPSTTARDLFVMSVRETSAVGFLANLFFTDEEIALIESGGDVQVDEYVETDTSLITVTQPADEPENLEPATDAWGYVDEDGDGIIVEPVSGEGYTGYMMIVLDPSRIRLGTIPISYGGRGYTVEEMVERFDAVAGINAGGFEDPEGLGNGSTPGTMTVYEGKVYFAAKGNQDGFVGFDSNHIMHVGNFTEAQIAERDIQYGVAFGPVLVVNGESADRSKLASGINPRTAIGQRSDGAVLLLVIDGRQTISIGCTWLDLVDIFLEFGAVNACNLDGGSSTLMWYQGDYINNCASVVGIRPVPTTFLVMKEGTDND